MARPEFDDIKTYAEFQKYKWYRGDLVRICKEHGLLFHGTDEKLNKVIESYFNGVTIPPERNWYTNKELNWFVNDNGIMLKFDLGLLSVSLLLCLIGIINKVRGLDDIHYVFYLVFGITGLIVALLFMHWDMDLEVIRSYRPVCGDRKFTRTQIDEQANSSDTEYMSQAGVFFAPDMLIGTTAGIVAVAYEDIASFKMIETWHTQRYNDYFIYKIILRTVKGKRVTIYREKVNEHSALHYMDEIYEHCLKRNPRIKLDNMRKSPFAPDNKPPQTVSGSDAKAAVYRAVQNGQLTRTTVSEDTKKRFIRFHMRGAFNMLLGAIIVSVITLAVILLIRVYVLKILLFVVLFFLYAIYNLFATQMTIIKNDIEFYYGEITGNFENGYTIDGTYGRRYGFIEDLSPDIMPDVGDRVIIARFSDEFSLVSDGSRSPDEAKEDHDR